MLKAAPAPDNGLVGTLKMSANALPVRLIVTSPLISSWYAI